MDFGYAAGGFADGLGGGLRTALDFVDFRDRRRYAEEDRKNKAEDRRLALEDRTLALEDGARKRRIDSMQETLTTDQFKEQTRQSKLRDAVRGGLSQRVQAENEARQQAATAMETTNEGMGGEPPALTLPPTPKGTLAMYDDMLDNPPPEWLGDPDYAKAITALRGAAEKEGLSEVYSAWKRKATPKEIGKIYNRFGNHFATEIKPGTAFSDDEVKALGHDPLQKNQLMVLIDDQGKHIPMHMGELGRFLGKESAPEYVKGPDNSGVVYNKNNPREFVQFPDQVTPESRAKTEEFRLRLTEADRKAWDNNVSRLNTAVKNSYSSGSEVNFDTELGAKMLRAQSLGNTWLANGMTYNGVPVEPERIAEVAREVADGRLNAQQLDSMGFGFSGRPAFLRGGQSGGGGGGGGARPLVVQSDTKPAAPPAGAPADGNWRRTEQGWIYVDKSGANAWQDDSPAPAKPADAKPAAKPAAAPAKGIPLNTQPEPGVMNLVRRALQPPTGGPTLQGTISMPGQPGERPIGQLSQGERLALQQAAQRAQTPTALDAAAPAPTPAPTPAPAPGPIALSRGVAAPGGAPGAMGRMAQEARSRAETPVEIPPKPTGGKGFTTKKSGDMEIYRFADGEVGFFEKNPDGSGMMFRRVDGRGQPKGTPIMVKDRETFIRIHSKGPR